MLNIKQIFHYQIMRELPFFFTNEREQMINESKKNKFIFNCFFLFKKKRKHDRVWDQYNL